MAIGIRTAGTSRLWVGRGTLTSSGHEGTFWSARNVPCLDLRGGHMAGYHVKIYHTVHLTICAFVCVNHVSVKKKKEPGFQQVPG